jgi:membrane-bound lytic murein transglycosylase D
MRGKTLITVVAVVVWQGYATAQTPPTQPSPDTLKFQHSQPRKVPPFPLVLNKTVEAYVDSYLEHSEGLKLSYARSAPYLNEMTEVLRQYGVPDDLVYLAFAESSFTKGGSGPWQLTKGTARRFGLQVNEFVDERRDPLKSTRAAAEYLATLHDQIGDWRLAIVAWNTGENLLSHFVRDRGEDFDRLLEHLPSRTRSLLGRLMAVAFISKNAKQYGIEEVVYTQPTPYARISVPGGTPLSSVASATHSEVYELKHLNPALLTDRIPPGGYEVVLPLSSKVDAPVDWNNAGGAAGQGDSGSPHDHHNH